MELKQTTGLEEPVPAYLDPGSPLETRVADLLVRMTLEEKLAQMQFYSPAIEQLNLPLYNWNAEELLPDETVTLFPQPIGQAATGDPALVHQIAQALTNEIRARHHHAASREQSGPGLLITRAQEHIPAIVETWYSGEEGGTAVADVLFGDYNPAGRLPITFHSAETQLPPIEHYAMAGRTYRYFKGEVLYPFGYGLSYSTFEYHDLQITPARIKTREEVEISVEVHNSSDRAGDEVVQLYVSDVAASGPVPYRQLQGFRRLHLLPGARQTVHFTLRPDQLALYDAEGNRWIEPGVFEISVGGQQPRWEDLLNTQSNILTGRFEVSGEKERLT